MSFGFHSVSMNFFLGLAQVNSVHTSHTPRGPQEKCCPPAVCSEAATPSSNRTDLQWTVEGKKQRFKIHKLGFEILLLSFKLVMIGSERRKTTKVTLKGKKIYLKRTLKRCAEHSPVPPSEQFFIQLSWKFCVMTVGN